MSDENWRPEISASDYFGHQQKKVTLADRRPLIRKAADLVGPGIGGAATRITDFSDLLATYNGYYSSLPGAVDAPNTTDSFVGITVMDKDLGGWQEFRSVESGQVYTRLFTRNITDPSTIYWSAWSGTTSTETYVGDWVECSRTGTPQAVPPSAETLAAWNSFAGPAASMTASAAGVQVTLAGVYTLNCKLGFAQTDVVGNRGLILYKNTNEVWRGWMPMAASVTQNVQFSVTDTAAIGDQYQLHFYQSHTVSGSPADLNTGIGAEGPRLRVTRMVAL